jgi:hypothetical protein
MSREIVKFVVDNPTGITGNADGGYVSESEKSPQFQLINRRVAPFLAHGCKQKSCQCASGKSKPVRP